jgi:hypothetical protein
LTFKQRAKWKANKLWEQGTQMAAEFWSGQAQPALLTALYACGWLLCGYLALLGVVIYRQQARSSGGNGLLILKLQGDSPAGATVVEAAQSDGRTPVERIINEP